MDRLGYPEWIKPFLAELEHRLQSALNDAERWLKGPLDEATFDVDLHSHKQIIAGHHGIVELYARKYFAISSSCEHKPILIFHDCGYVVMILTLPSEGSS